MMELRLKQLTVTSTCSPCIHLQDLRLGRFFIGRGHIHYTSEDIRRWILCKPPGLIAQLTCSFISKQCGTLQVVVLAITSTSSALWIASRLEIPALNLHPPAVSASPHISGRDTRTPAVHIYMHQKYHHKWGQHQYFPPTHTHPSTYKYIHGFSLASFAIPFFNLLIDLLYGIGMVGEPSISNHDDNTHTFKKNNS